MQVKDNCVTGLIYFYSIKWHIHSIFKSPGVPPHADCDPFVSRYSDASTRRTARRLAPKFKRLTFQIGIVFHFSTVKRVRPVIARSKIEFVIKGSFLVVTLYNFFIFFSKNRIYLKQLLFRYKLKIIINMKNTSRITHWQNKLKNIDFL